MFNNVNANSISLCLFLHIWIWLLQSEDVSFKRAAKVKKTSTLVCLLCDKNTRSTDHQVVLIGSSHNTLFTLGDSS